MTLLEGETVSDLGFGTTYPSFLGKALSRVESEVSLT